MAYAPSNPENRGPPSPDLLADEVERLRLFNEELDLRAERMDRRARDLAHAMEMRAAELDAREQQLWEEQQALRGEVERSRSLLLSERREFEEWRLDEAKRIDAKDERIVACNTEYFNRELASFHREVASLRAAEAVVADREKLQRGREAELAHWQSQLEAREDELATAQAQLDEEREAFARRVRRYDEESSSVSPPPEGDF